MTTTSQHSMFGIVCTYLSDETLSQNKKYHSITIDNHGKNKSKKPVWHNSTNLIV